MSNSKKMLVFHSAYTFDDLRKRGLEIFVTSRDAGEIFDAVLTVSPVASLQYLAEHPRMFTGPEFYELDSRNVVLEGKVGRFQSLKRLRLLNFALAQLSLLFTLFRHGQLRDVELVRAEDPRFNGLYGYLFSRLLRKPFVVGVWGNPAQIRKSIGTPMTPRLFPTVRLEEIVERFILRRASMVLAQNQDNMDFAIALGVSPTKSRILPLGVGIDSAHFLSKDDRMDVSEDFEELQISGEFIIVCVSRLELVKLVDHAIRASRVLKQAKLRFNLVLIGEGRERGELERLAKELGMEKEVVFVGNRSQEWIAGALARIQLAIAPLTGRALLEIGLAGCPVVAYDVDWHSDIVIDGITGELVKNLDYQKLGEAALELLQNDLKRIEMGNNMREVAMKMADPHLIIEKQMDVYQSLLQRNRS